MVQTRQASSAHDTAQWQPFLHTQARAHAHDTVQQPVGGDGEVCVCVWGGGMILAWRPYMVTHRSFLSL